MESTRAHESFRPNKNASVNYYQHVLSSFRQAPTSADMRRRIANSVVRGSLAVIITYPTSASGIIVLLKTDDQQILLQFADFILQEIPDDRYFSGMV